LVNTEEPCPLAFVCHFVGDVHQPLHVGYLFDIGANEFLVSFLGQQTNLHHTWDTEMIGLWLKRTSTDWQQLADELIDQLKSQPQLVSDFQSEVNEIRWANESFQFARLDAYNMSPGSRLFGPMEDQKTPVASSLTSSVQEREATKKKYEQELRQKAKALYKRSFEEDFPDGFPIQDNMKHSSCNGSLGLNYYEKNVRIIKRRISQAGVRLAHLLNWIYTEPSSKN